MEPLQIPVKTSRLYLLAAVFTTTLAVSVLIMLNLELIMMAILRIGIMVLAFFGTTISGYAMLYFLMRSRQKPPVLIADSEKLSWDVSVFNRGDIAWSNIRDYTLIKHAGRFILLVNLKEPYDVIEHQPWLTQRLLIANLNRYRTPVAIPASYVDGEPSEVLRQISEFGKKRS